MLCLESFFGFAADAQVGPPVSDGASKAINLGGRGWSAPAATAATAPKEEETLQFNAKAGFASDYIYRGTTLSDRKPAIGAGIEATFRSLYAGATVATVRLPTRPYAEFTMAAGVRPTLGKIDFDFGATYFLYPGETTGGPTNGIEYWEAAGRAGTAISESVPHRGRIRLSPNVSNTGAWSQYAAAGSATRCRSPAAARLQHVVHRRRRLFLVRHQCRRSAASRCLPISTGRRE